MKTQCPHCNTIQKAPEEYSDKSVKCKQCGNDFSPQILVFTNKKPDPPLSHPSQPLRLPSPNYLHMIAVISAILSILGAIASYGNAIVLMGSLICLLLSFILAAIANVVDAVNDNTRARENK